MVKAEIIKDSVSSVSGIRLVTMKLRYPKFIHGELMTHRVFSRNASSSRAIPSSMYLEEVERDDLRAAPEEWGAASKGMQSKTPLDADVEIQAKNLWRSSALDAARNGRGMSALKVHKQFTNRGLDTYVHINVVVSSTEWHNFFGLRLDADADPTMRALAVTMYDVFRKSEPATLRVGEYHLPFILDAESARLKDGQLMMDLIMVSVARCARVSYESFDTGKLSTLEEDLKLYERLLDRSHALHASPAEHVATPDEFKICQHHDLCGADDLNGMRIHFLRRKQHGNFYGWIQHRKLLSGEAVAALPPGYVL